MERLKELRARYGLTYRDLSCRVGIDFSRLSLIEKGKTEIRTDTLSKLTNYFSVTSDYILGKSDVGFLIFYATSDSAEIAYVTENDLDVMVNKGLITEEEKNNRIFRGTATIEANAIVEAMVNEKLNRVIDDSDNEFFEKFKRLTEDDKLTVSQMVDFLLSKENK